MSEVLWNIVGVLIVGCFILSVRKRNGDKIHPQILTVYWIVFFIVSLMPIPIIAEMGATIGSANYIYDGKINYDSRQNEYLELKDMLDNQNKSSLLEKEAVKKVITTTCLLIWLSGLLWNLTIKMLRMFFIRKVIRRKCIGIHSCVSIGKKKVNVFVTDEIGPMVYGIRPAIYIPKEFVSGDIYNSILMHEKIHIIRKHYFILVLIDIVSSIYWFLPYYESFLMDALREDMEYRCDYEVLKNQAVDSKEYISHYVLVNGYQSGLRVPLNFGKERVMKRVERILDCKVNIKKSVCISFIFGILLSFYIILLAKIYVIPDMNGVTKWETKQAKSEVVNIISALNKGDKQSFSRYIYKSGPLSNVTDFSDMQYDICYINYYPGTSNYYKTIYTKQHQLEQEKMIHLEGILKNIEGSEMIWGFTLIFDEIDGIWKLYDWGQ